jgi:hypothetical protein
MASNAIVGALSGTGVMVASITFILLCDFSALLGSFGHTTAVRIPAMVAALQKVL